MSDFMTPAAARFGWAGPKEAEISYEKLSDNFVNFFIAQQTAATSRMNVRLYESEKLANNGRYFPCFQQLVGSCVGQGLARVIWTLMAIEKFRLGQDSEAVIMPYEPFGYGASRVLVNGWTSGEGSTGAAAATAAMKYGTLRSDVAGLPKWKTGTDSSGNVHTIVWPAEVDNSFGNSKAVLNKWKGHAVEHLIGSAARVKGYETVRDALGNYFPCTIASTRGFKMKPVFDKGKWWGVPSGTWNHQMCFLAVDDDPSRPGVWCQNSWGFNAHGTPAADTPAGGFWVDAEVVDWMARTGECYAFSQFKGFPEQRQLDHMLI